jgi:hypothetical protein
LEGRIFTVHLNDSTVTPKSITSGIPQGAVLSTTLSFLYLSDMPRAPHIHLAFYADDIARLSQSWPPDTISRRLGNAIMILRKYFTTWKPRLHTHKTETALFSKRRPPSPTPFKSRTPLCPGLRPSAIKALCYSQNFSSPSTYTPSPIKLLFCNIFPFLTRDSALTQSNKLALYKLLIRSILT